MTMTNKSTINGMIIGNIIPTNIQELHRNSMIIGSNTHIKQLSKQPDHELSRNYQLERKIKISCLVLHGLQ